MNPDNWVGSWNWTKFCPTGLKPFEGHSTELLPCFQKIVLQIPVYTLFAALSANYFGSNTDRIARNALQLRLLHMRTLVSTMLALLPVGKIFFFHHVGTKLYGVDVLVVCTECVMWAVHCGYLLSARRCGRESHRGPLALIVLWLMVFVLHAVWLHTNGGEMQWWGLVTIALDTCYGLCLIPRGSATLVPVHRGTDDREQEVLLPNRYTQFQRNFNESVLGHAQDEANCASRFLFYWVEPLIKKGIAGKLVKLEDLFDLPDALNIMKLAERLQLCLSQQRTFLRALHRCFGSEFYSIGLLRFVADISSFAGPLLLGGLLRQKDSGADVSYWPYLYAFGLFAATLLSAICSSHFNWRMAMIGMKMRISVVSAIYRKVLEARGLKDSRPEILNLMSTDTDRIVNSCISFHSLWSIPFQLITTLYLLYLQLGAAFIAGVVFAASLIPLNRWLAQRIAHYSQGLMTAKDARLAATYEVMAGAKQVKLHAWEDVFIDKIRELRNEEVKFLARRKYLDALCVYFWATTPVLMCFLTFGLSALMGNALVAATTYTSVALLNMLIGPLNAFPWVLNGLIEAWISMKRVEELINLPDLDFSSYYNPVMRASSSTSQKVNDRPIVLQIENATFEHDVVATTKPTTTTTNTSTDAEHNIFRLEGINLTIRKGDLICIEGCVGGGKSTLIAAIVAGARCVHGVVCVHEPSSGFGYVPQVAWLQNGTIRSNIVWGATFDELWYKKVLYACALLEDLEALGGDLVELGENARTLSGGQRARVALARAVYQDKKIYLLDDILSSLDAHVAHHIIKHCILGLLKEKTRLIVTSSVTLFFHANQILHMENGKLSSSDLMTGSFDLSTELLESPQDDKHDTIRRASFQLSDFKRDHNEGNEQGVDSIEESREYGNISVSVVLCYCRAVKKSLTAAVLISVILMQVSRNLSDAWLAHWVTETTLATNAETSGVSVGRDMETLNDTTTLEHNTSYYLGIFAMAAALNSLLTIARAFLFAYAGLKAAKLLHERLLHKVMFATFSFFDVTSVGRILNRFSSDTYTADDSLPFSLNVLLAQMVGLAGAIIISLYAMPWLGLVIIPIVPIYLNLQHSYRYASRDIKRLSSNALSPLYSHFTETIHGLVTIRTMHASARFQRDFHAKLEESIKAQLSSTAAQQWLGMRLQLLGTLLVGSAGLLAALTAAHLTNPGLVGLAISYALSMTGLLGGVLGAFAETEQQFVAIERIDQYLQLEGEQNANGSIDPPFGWPSQGSLMFKDVELRYRDHLTPVLRHFNFKTEAFERVAIVGRTGAGKTSVLAALMRIAPLSAGEIVLDYVNLKALSLRILRDRIGLLPQDPFLFEGTVRQNLDPRRIHYDSEMWHAITSCASAMLLVQTLGGLDGRLEKGGSNLSAGQKQLICLVRALLKNAKVICIDEGTANLDDESAAAIHLVIRNSFRGSTVLFIAHRLNELQRMDRIVVMDHGAIIEQGPPKALAQNKTSMFHSMLRAQHVNVEDFCREV